MARRSAGRPNRLPRLQRRQGALLGIADRRRHATIWRFELAEKPDLHGLHRTALAGAASPRQPICRKSPPPQRHDSPASGLGRRLTSKSKHIEEGRTMIEIDGLTRRYGDKMTGLPSDQGPQAQVRLQPPDQRRATCSHRPPCPPADRPDRDAARIIAFHPEQGWSLLCNGVILFDDTGELLPDGRAVPPHRLIHIRRPLAA